MSEWLSVFGGAGLMVVVTYACVYWMERTHNRNMREMQERHEHRMAEWRAAFAQAEWRIAEPPAEDSSL